MNTYILTTVSQILTVENCINSEDALTKAGLKKEDCTSIKFDTGLLSHLYEIAYRAHTGTSFSPEERGRNIVREYSETLAMDLAGMPEQEQEQYKASFERHLTAWLRAKGNCISTMITGGSNFPVRRAEKANQSEHNRYTEFSEWRERTFKALEQRKEAAKPKSQKDNEEFARISKGILSSCETIIGIDNGTVRGSSRALFVSNLTGRINTIAKSGNVELLSKCLDLIKEVNATVKKPVISSGNSIWKLLEAAEARREAQFDRANKPSREYEIPNGKILFNYELDRLQILFDGKPDYSVISKLKQNGFKWAPSNMAWQRQLTNNAIYGAVNVVGEFRKPAAPISN